MQVCTAFQIFDTRARAHSQILDWVEKTWQGQNALAYFALAISDVKQVLQY
jgi:hypothetical protein